MAQSILVVDDSETMLKLVSQALKGEGYELLLASDGKTALDIIGSVALDLALLDVVLPDMQGYDICKAMRSNPRTAQIPIIMLTGLGDLENRLQAFESGADDFMPKPFQMQELQARVRVQLRRTLRNPPPTQEVEEPFLQRTAVFSLRGGLGVSTLAVNLAAGLQQLWGLRTLLVDMAFVNGQAALMLDVPLKYTWADIGRIPADDVEHETLERVILHHGSGLDVLAAPKQVENAELISQKHIERMFELTKDQYKYMVMDLPHDFSVTTVTALDTVDTILYMVSPDLASVHCASNALRVFKDLGYPEEKVQVVLNWNFSTTGLARKEIEKALQKPISVVIPFIQDTLVMALTMGKPVVLEAGKAEAALFEDLAYFWSGVEHKKNELANPGPSLQRVLERAKRRQLQKQKTG
jgi:pilus assembly protein CpaE